ncbi:MAG: nucleotidyltransferase domain-containing protein [Ginsengibacter sp.]
MITNRKIQEVTDIIVEEIQPEKVFLFGSYASGNADKNSDLDIIVVVNKQLKKEKRIESMVKLNLKTALPDLLFPKDFKMYSLEEYNKQKDNKFSFLCSALQNAKILYERK